MSADAAPAKLRFFVPEVVQSSAMDCGPAALKSLFEGHGIPISYGRLREACQTDVDGTSIDTMEEIALQLGLQAEQIMVPADHVLLPEANTLPAIVVVRLPDGNTHFIVVWSYHAGLVQVMDPAFGRRWISGSRLVRELYQHVMPISAKDWREWASSEEALATLRRRLANLGISETDTVEIIDRALTEPGWYPLGCLDAATRAVDSIVRSGGLRRGREAATVLESLVDRAGKEDGDPFATIPKAYWSVRSASSEAREEEEVIFRGAVMVRVRGVTPDVAGDHDDEPSSVSPELMAARQEAPSRPGHELFRLLRVDGLLAPASLTAALFGAALGVVLEALLFRGLLELAPQLEVTGQRFGALGALILLMLLLLLLELPTTGGELRLGRRLEARLRIAFQEKIPRLGDRYFRSRLTSDMAQRNHAVHFLRLLPRQGGELIRSVFELVLTAAGIVWLDPASALLAIVAATMALGLPLAAQPLLAERDLRVRSHVGGLGRFYLDALLGLVALRAHGAEGSLRTEHEGLLVEWSHARLSLQRAVVALEGVQGLVGYGLAAWLLLNHLGRGGQIGIVLLLAYWALNLPVLGLELARLAWQYPAHRNIALRLLEPLGAREESSAGKVTPDEIDKAPGVSISLQGISVRAAGHIILDAIDLDVEAGSHVAVVGSSGAGKTSLFGVLLGWHRPASGVALVDGAPLEGEKLQRLRAETAWVDPAVQLWNRTFLDNLRYGTSTGSALPLTTVIEQADLRKVLETLPEGHQTYLGEGGGLVSGGEGQRVRFGRALVRPGVRLVILDEPFRGLAREQRAELLVRARRLWQRATLLCVTHDITETRFFDRVLVVENGRIVEDDTPESLAGRRGTRYRSMLDAEEALRQVWSDSSWRRWQLVEGRVRETNGRVTN